MSGEINGTRAGGKRRRVWCETLSSGELLNGPALGWLGPRTIHPIIAVRPFDALDEVAKVVARAQSDALLPAIWPMLEDREGRWCNAENVEAFARFAESVVLGLEKRGAKPSELAIDLEPPIGAVRTAFVDQVTDPRSRSVDQVTDPRSRSVDQVTDPRSRSVERGGGAVNVWAPLASRSPLAPAAQRLRRLIEEMRTLGVECSAAFAPPVLLDSKGSAVWQRLLGTPVDRLGWARAGPMLYTSLFEGWSRKFIDRDAARALLAAGCARTRERFGKAAAASLGCVGTGALESEPVMRSVDELADDVAISRASGVDDLALFDLGGIYRRSKNGEGAGEAWLDAFVETEAAVRVPELSFALRAMLGLGAVATRFSSGPSW